MNNRLTATIESRLFAVNRPLHISLLLHHLIKQFTSVSAGVIAGCASGLRNVTSKSIVMQR